MLRLRGKRAPAAGTAWGLHIDDRAALWAIHLEVGQARGTDGAIGRHDRSAGWATARFGTRRQRSGSFWKELPALKRDGRTDTNCRSYTDGEEQLFPADDGPDQEQHNQEDRDSYSCGLIDCHLKSHLNMGNP